MFKNYAHPCYNKHEGQGDLQWGKKKEKEIFPQFEKNHRRFFSLYLPPHKKLGQKTNRSLQDQRTIIFDSANLFK